MVTCKCHCASFLFVNLVASVRLSNCGQVAYFRNRPPLGGGDLVGAEGRNGRWCHHFVYTCILMSSVIFGFWKITLLRVSQNDFPRAETKRLLD